jgi:hypothetical protein
VHAWSSLTLYSTGNYTVDMLDLSDNKTIEASICGQVRPNTFNVPLVEDHIPPLSLLFFNYRII